MNQQVGHWLPRPEPDLLVAFLPEPHLLSTVERTGAVSCAAGQRRDGKGWIGNNENCATGKKIANKVVTNRQKVRVPAFTAQVDGWMRATAEFRKEHGAHGVIVTGDFNLDWKKSWVRRYLKPKVALSGANISGWKSWQASTRTRTLRIPGKAPRARIIDVTCVGGTGVGIPQPTFAYTERVPSDHHATGTVIRLPR